MRFEILTIDEIKPEGEYKHIATMYIHPSWLFKLWKKPIKKQAVSDESGVRRWFWTDTFRQTTIDDSLNRFLKKQDYEKQIMSKLTN